MYAHKIFFRKNKTKHTQYYFQNMQYRGKLLKRPYKYKNNYFTSCTQKITTAIATNMGKTYFAVF